MAEEDAGRRELYDRVQRFLIGSLLEAPDGMIKVLEILNEEDIEEPSYSLIFNAMADLSRKNSPITIITVAEELQKSGNLAKVGGPSELYDLKVEGESYCIEAPVEIYAKIIKESSAKAKVTKTLDDSKDDFKDDSGVQASDAISNLQNFLNDRMLSLSDASTVSNFNEFKEYLELIEERKKISEDNENNAEGLQGIPSLLPTLNKYTTGWRPGQMITVGAGTGIGKALWTETPMLTNNGWSTMGKLKIGDKVFGRDGKICNVTNVTEVMKNRKCYEMIFSNGEKIIADENHQWLVNASREEKDSIKLTKELFNNFNEVEYFIDFHEHNMVNEDSEKYSINFENNITQVYIKEINEVDSLPVRCIEVDSIDHMYLAGKSLIPTHNSVFAVNCAVAAAKAGKSVMFFSLEMGRNEIEDRIISSSSAIPLNKLRQGKLDGDDYSNLNRQMDEMKDMKITIDIEPKQTVDSIRARAIKQASSKEGLDFIVIDYLQLITPTGRFGSRQEAVADISRNMKLLAKQLEVPIMVLVQMKRKDDDDTDSLPKLDNIRESGAIAQDSDIVILLHRDINNDETIPHTLVILAKNRSGENNKTIRCHSNLECSLLREVTKVKDIEELGPDDDLSLDSDLDLDELDSLDSIDDIILGDLSDD